MDDREPVRLGVFAQARPRSTAEWIRKYPEGLLLPDVSLSLPHTVVVRHKGKAIESFRFRLDASERDQCIFLNELGAERLGGLREIEGLRP